MEVINESEIERQFEIFEKTFSPEEKEQALEIISHISRSLNDKTLRGKINFEEFKTLLLSNVEPLFYLSVIKHFNYFEDRLAEKSLDEMSYEELERLYVETEKNSDDAELLKGKEKFWSALTLTYLLFTRVLDGKDLELIRAEIESRKPTLIASQK